MFFDAGSLAKTSVWYPDLSTNRSEAAPACNYRSSVFRYAERPCTTANRRASAATCKEHRSRRFPGARTVYRSTMGRSTTSPTDGAWPWSRSATQARVTPVHSGALLKMRRVKRHPLASWSLNRVSPAVNLHIFR